MLLISTSGYHNGTFPPGVKDFKRAVQVSHHLLVAHAKAVQAYKALGQGGVIGVAHAFVQSYPASQAEKDVNANEMAQLITNRWFLDPMIKGEYPEILLEMLRAAGNAPVIEPEDMELLKNNKLDFLGINYYQRAVVADIDSQTDGEDEKGTGKTANNAMKPSLGGLFTIVKPTDGEYTEWGWDIFPDGIYDGLINLSRLYGDLPIYITENGIGAVDQLENGQVHDPYRSYYISRHLVRMLDAIEDGVNLKGYFPWSTIDLFSWLNGYKKRYGFIYVDFEDGLKRYKKDSFEWYKTVAETNGACLFTENQGG
jgi:6-phospho-beta-glucosidase